MCLALLLGGGWAAGAAAGTAKGDLLRRLALPFGILAMVEGCEVTNKNGEPTEDQRSGGMTTASCDQEKDIVRFPR